MYKRTQIHVNNKKYKWKYNFCNAQKLYALEQRIKIQQNCFRHMACVYFRFKRFLFKFQIFMAKL